MSKIVALRYFLVKHFSSGRHYVRIGFPKGEVVQMIAPGGQLVAGRDAEYSVVQVIEPESLKSIKHQLSSAQIEMIERHIRAAPRGTIDSNAQSASLAEKLSTIQKAVFETLPEKKNSRAQRKDGNKAWCGDGGDRLVYGWRWRRAWDRSS